MFVETLSKCAYDVVKLFEIGLEELWLVKELCQVLQM